MMLLFLSHGLIKVSSLGLYLVSAYLINNVLNQNNIEQEGLQEEDGCLNRRNINRWLKVKKIEPFKMGRELYVNKILVDFELQKEICLNLRKMYPKTWFQIFMAGTDDSHIIYMIKEHFDCIDDDVGAELRNIGVTIKKKEFKHFNDL